MIEAILLSFYLGTNTAVIGFHERVRGYYYTIIY